MSQVLDGEQDGPTVVGCAPCASPLIKHSGYHKFYKLRTATATLPPPGDARRGRRIYDLESLHSPEGNAWARGV